MTAKIRAFISSTMEDLGNERRAVVQNLSKLGIEPIIAETMAPNGMDSWSSIKSEIDQCHIFVLILGERYGWEPKAGYGAGRGLSVTHLEFEEAKRQGKLILPFLKKLPYGAAVDQKRDEFRRNVSDWDHGHFRQEFEWADDLGSKVASAVIRIWSESFIRDQIRKANPTKDSVPIRQLRSFSTATPSPNRVLLAGAGMSVAAGYPTAALMMRLIARDLGLNEDHHLLYRGFGTLCSLYKAARGRLELEQCIKKALDSPLDIRPTSAHLEAVRLFKNIVTTNFDMLFEKAAESQGVPLRVILPDDKDHHGDFDGLTLYKISGSVGQPSSLILTGENYRAAVNSSLLNSVKDLLTHHELIVIGHSLVDSHVEYLLENRNQSLNMTYVAPYVDPSESQLLEKTYGLTIVIAKADEFMEAYSSQL